MYENQNELYHHGVKGMRWGVRRYQNSDGSLTAAGKKRYGTKTNFEKVMAAKERSKTKAKAEEARAKANARTQKEIDKYNAKTQKKLDKINGSNKESEKENTSKKKSVSEMTDQELRDKIARIQLENQLKSLEPQQVSKGKNFADFMVKEVGKEVVLQAAQKAGRNYLQAKFQDMLGVDIKKDVGPVLREIKKEAEKEIKKEAESVKQAYEEETSSKASDKKTSGKSDKKTSEKSESKSSTKSDDEPLTGTVEGEGKSRYTEKEGPVVDGVWRDIPASSSEVSSFVPAGIGFTSQYLLEDKSRR